MIVLAVGETCNRSRFNFLKQGNSALRSPSLQGCPDRDGGDFHRSLPERFDRFPW